jgi:hypothetical protein
MSRTLPVLERELERWPGVEARLDRRHKHPRLIVTVGGQQRFVCFSSTKTSRDGVRNAVASLRRMLRELGAQRA